MSLVQFGRPLPRFLFDLIAHRGAVPPRFDLGLVFVGFELDLYSAIVFSLHFDAEAGIGCGPQDHHSAGSPRK